MTRFMLVGALLVTLIAAAPDGASAQAITDVWITAHEDAGNRCPSGYHWINQDLNEDAGGDWIYFCTQRGSGSPLTDITFTSHPQAGNRCPSGWGWVDVDLNRGSGGNYIYMCYRRSGSRPIVLFEVRSSDSSGATCGVSAAASSGLLNIGVRPSSVDWTWVDVDLNHTVGGKYIYLCYAHTAELPDASAASGLDAPILDTDMAPSSESLMLPGLVMDSWEQQVLGRVKSAGPSGYTLTNAVWVGVLEAGDDVSHYVTLSSSGDYVFTAFCDTDCSDLDLEIFRGGTSIDDDFYPDDHPRLSLSGPTSGRYRLEVSMPSCSTATCYYSLGVWAR